MVIPTVQLSNVVSNSLDAFDVFQWMAIGDDNTTPIVGDTALGNELLRKALDTTSIKNLGAGTYRFQMRIALTELNGSTLEEIGIFDQASLGGNMGSKNLLTVAVSKTSDKEIVIIVQVTITAANG